MRKDLFKLLRIAMIVYGFYGAAPSWATPCPDLFYEGRMNQILTTVDQARKQSHPAHDRHYPGAKGADFAVDLRSTSVVKEELLHLISVASVSYSPGSTRVLHLRGDDKGSLEFASAMIEKGDVSTLLEAIGAYKIRLHIHNPTVSVIPLYVDIYRASGSQGDALVLSNNEIRGVRHSVYEKDFSGTTILDFVRDHYPTAVFEQLSFD